MKKLILIHKKELCQFIEFFVFKQFFFVKTLKRSQYLVQNLKKITRSQKLQIANGNEKLDTILSQVNAVENSLQTIGNIFNNFQLLTNIITERFNNILKGDLTIISGK